MTAVELHEDRTLSLIVDSLSRYGNQWRTVQGIARDAGLPPQEVALYMQSHPQHFVGSHVTLGGQQLVRLRTPADRQSPWTGALTAAALLALGAWALSDSGDNRDGGGR